MPIVTRYMGIETVQAQRYTIAHEIVTRYMGIETLGDRINDSFNTHCYSLYGY